MVTETRPQADANAYNDWIPQDFKNRLISEELLKALGRIPKGETENNLTLIVRALMNKCKDGNMKAIALLLDRIEGRPSQDINVRKLEISITGEDMLRVITEAKAALQRKLLSPVVRVLPPDDVIEGEIVEATGNNSNDSNDSNNSNTGNSGIT